MPIPPDKIADTPTDLKEVQADEKQIENIPDREPLAIDVVSKAELAKIVATVLGEHCRQHPESGRVVRGKHIFGLTPEQVAELVFPSRIFDKTLEEKLTKIDEMDVHDRMDMAMRLAQRGITTSVSRSG